MFYMILPLQGHAAHAVCINGSSDCMCCSPDCMSAFFSASPEAPVPPKFQQCLYKIASALSYFCVFLLGK